MLLQRASAGSGKTFKLAKTYIRLFISVKEEDNDFYRLLSPEELRDKHSHILGVTFTNKATNEMKQRIVENLAALATTVPDKGLEPVGYKFPNYMLDFTGESANADPIEDVIYVSRDIPAQRHEITRSCRAALKVLLNDYGNFNISTIDSFFQSVLRTLAYELRLNDTYHVELNDDYLAQMGVDETLGSVKDTEHTDKERSRMAEYMSLWLRTVMSRRLHLGEAWDPFSKRGSTGIYHELLSLAGKMNREDFKKHLSDLTDYFSTPERFMNFYNGMLTGAREVERLHRRTIDAVRRLTAKISLEDFKKGIPSGLTSILMSAPFGKPDTGVKFDVNRSDCEVKPGSANFPFLKSSPHFMNPESLNLFTEVCDSLYRWQYSRLYWSTLLSRLHYLGPLNFIAQSIDKFREENNVIPLSATNEILQGIIAKDEVPFIYERTGVKLHHFLLDEFQDTSLMQWENLKPLLAQSDSYNYDNLIIGDAKQSIYRFRNAAPELITGGVEEDFPYTRVLPNLSDKGTPLYDSVNTNWRSSRHIVSFNNSLFDSLVRILDTQEGDNYFSTLYDNVIQKVKNTDSPGYIKIDFGSKNGFSTTPALIDEIRERGFRLSDIAVLVDTSTDGRKVIEAIIRHNRKKSAVDDSYTPIDFISAESLSVAEATSVKVIVSVMSIIARDFISPGSNESAYKSDKLRRSELERLVANLNISLSTESLGSIAEVAAAKEIINTQEIESLYRRPGAGTLPGLVESIASHFLTEAMQTSQAAYIAAFQDAVLQYCDTYPSDINTFLDWWSDNGKAFSIAAPEGINAIQIMTIHKSKGLEFKVVIIPQADWSIAPQKEYKEIIWINHIPETLSPDTAADAPAVLPVTPNAQLMDNPDSPFYSAYSKFKRECRTDQLNKTYVAFTRAIRELHITAPVSKEESSGKKMPVKIGGFMLAALTGIMQSDQKNDGNLINTEELNQENDIITYGTPITIHPDVVETDDENTIIIDRYSPKNGLKGAAALFSLDDTPC